MIKNTADEKLKADIELHGELAVKQKIAIANVREEAQATIDALMGDYAPYEIATFGIQLDEYTRYMDSPTAKTPNVNAMIKGRGITKDSLMVKIGEKADFIFTILGNQQGAVDAIKATTTLEELDALLIS